ncbi:MAG: glucose-1-phosphate thymidylyltransferase RfbA [Deltaproteobacteria bacterium]|nr:glucose-1-phosphate thymidylyltransferase RfbA [Deltaproteobacteria bacterium]
MSVNKGIILAGGAGSRLYPLTRVASKQLMPVYDKPMIYYPLATIMMAGIRKVLLISTPEDVPRFEALLGDGRGLGLEISYTVQERPEGIAQAFILGRDFIAAEPVCLILGDNIFYGKYLFLEPIRNFSHGALIYGYYVKDPQRYGVVEFDGQGRAVSLEEKPQAPKSHYAVPGLYVYDGRVAELAAGMKPSARGELEITDLNRIYLEQNELMVQKIGRGVAWLDTGTHLSLLEAGSFIGTLEQRQGLKFGCLEEIAWRMGFIDRKGLEKLVAGMPVCPYRGYLEAILSEEQQPAPIF